MKRSPKPVSTDMNKLQKWVRDVRSDVTSQTPSIDVLESQTDIPGNHGAILTFAKEDIPLFDMGPGRVYEERSTETATPEQIKALSVPLNRVDEYKEKVKALGLSCPVLPIEAVDYHFSKFPLRELTTEARVV